MQNKPLQIGVTGGIGSGKSTVCRIFSILGIHCYNADRRARWLIENDLSLINTVKSIFGPNAYVNKLINRKFIAHQSFNNQAKLDQLNEAVHPKVAIDYEDWLNGQNSVVYVVKEAALLFESGSYKNLNSVINVSAPMQMRLKRILQRDEFRKESEIMAIIDKQLPDEARSKLADYEIINDESQSLIIQVHRLHREFLSLNRSIHD